jgi:nucleoside-diphosphate-sugar epimerase
MKGKITENDPIIPHSTYGVSKVAADGLVQVRWREAKVPAIAMRQFNCVGERETHAYVIPEIINQLSISDTVKLGNNSFRDFQYSGDAVRMAVELLEKGEFGEVYNMGSEGGIKIYDLANLIGELMGYDSIEIVVEQSRVRPWEIWHLQSDNTKLYSVIGKKEPTPLRVALERTIEYYRDNNSKWDW